MPMRAQREKSAMRLHIFAWPIALFLASCTQQSQPTQSASTEESNPSVPRQDSPQSPQQEAPTPKDWVWVKSGRDASTSLDVDTGHADVTIDNENFSARLYWKQRPTEVKISLEGMLHEGQITAREVIRASDYTGSVYTGTYLKTEAVETINLSDGLGMIGIIKRTTQ